MLLCVCDSGRPLSNKLFNINKDSNFRVWEFQIAQRHLDQLIRHWSDTLKSGLCPMNVDLTACVSIHIYEYDILISRDNRIWESFREKLHHGSKESLLKQYLIQMFQSQTVHHWSWLPCNIWDNYYEYLWDANDNDSIWTKCDKSSWVPW